MLFAKHLQKKYDRLCIHFKLCFSLCLVCVLMCLCMHMCAMYEHMCVCGSWSSTLVIFLSYPPHQPLRQGLSSNLDLADLARPTGPQPCCPSSPNMQFINTCQSLFTWVLGNKYFTNQAISQVSFLVFPHLPKQEEIFQLTAAGGPPGILSSYSLIEPEHVMWRRSGNTPRA